MANGWGGARPGAGRPKGLPDQRLRDFQELCQRFLETKSGGRETRFERAAKILLHPIIEAKRNNKGEPIEGTEYLVNANAMIGTLELVAGYAYGRPRQQVEHSGSVDAPTNLEPVNELLAALGYQVRLELGAGKPKEQPN